MLNGVLKQTGKENPERITN